ncbi:MAG: TonB-dependent receptor plug domain-containing protein, partial [Bacteroidia bacterium]
SARSFTVEETSRYAAAAYDPARMSQNFAGVTIAGDDLSNEIVVRGNSPKGVLWRLEGIEITNPNHFAAGGSQGGAISMLSSSTLGNSDFYTGAFPAEYGNALSGVFDLKFRKGNNKKRESAFMFGFLGLEASSEGPFRKDYEGSYLINYRYSTLGILEKMGVSPTGDLLPVYQDLSYNIFLPTKKIGNFSVFGVMGLNEAELTYDYDANDTTELTIDSYENFAETGFVNNTGIKHIINLNNKGYIKTIASHSYSNTLAVDNVLEIDSTTESKTVIFQEDDIKNKESQFRLSTMLNYKLNSRNILRVGGVYSNIQYDFKSTFYDYTDRSTFVAFKNNNRSAQYQAFGQYKSRLTSELTLNAGIHYTRLQATKASSLEPRASLSYKTSRKSSFTISAGKHSKAEHLSLYMYNHKLDDGSSLQPNTELELSKAWHYVLAYDYKINPNLRLKSEAYYQSLFDIPISSKPGSTISSINTANYWDAIFGSDTIQQNNGGTGVNYGIDLTLERFFNNDYYYLTTLTLFNSTYKTSNQESYNTLYNGNYMLNILGGKEFQLKKKNRTLSINGKFVFYGGNRYTPIKLEESIATGETVQDLTNPFGARVENYFRFDWGATYKFNRAKTSHSISLDIQNTTNRQNIGGYYYNEKLQKQDSWTLNGLLPFFNYRIEF